LLGLATILRTVLRCRRSLHLSLLQRLALPALPAHKVLRAPWDHRVLLDKMGFLDHKVSLELIVQSQDPRGLLALKASKAL
jgi:hypothetical protein